MTGYSATKNASPTGVAGRSSEWNGYRGSFLSVSEGATTRYGLGRENGPRDYRHGIDYSGSALRLLYCGRATAERSVRSPEVRLDQTCTCCGLPFAQCAHRYLYGRRS